MTAASEHSAGPTRLSPPGEPLVSIGVPVRNGGRFLGEALDSLRGQSYRNLEIIISDNASTDHTAEVGLKYAALDSRIQYHRLPDDIGAPANWNLVVRQATGTYFKWASANDRCAADFVAKCVARLQADPSKVLCYTRTVRSDDDGNAIDVVASDFACLSDTPNKRFAQILFGLVMNNAQAGVIRTGALRQTGLDRLYPQGDHVLMAELALLGKFDLIEEPLFVRRVGESTFSHLLSVDDQTTFFDPGRKRPFRALLWRRLFDTIKAASALPLPRREKLACYVLATRYCWLRRRILWRDLWAG